MKYGSPTHRVFDFVVYGMPLMYVVASLKFIAWDNIDGLLIAVGLWCVAYMQYAFLIGQKRFDKEEPPVDYGPLLKKLKEAEDREKKK